MITFSHIIEALQILLLLYVALTDIAARIIPNKASLIIALLALMQLPFAEPYRLLSSLAITLAIFALLLTLWGRGMMGGGDVKLLAAFSIGLPLAVVIQFLCVTVLIGGALALVHLAMRLLPYPALAPLGSSYVRRVCAVERWRHLRHAPLPYGVAIACGGIWTILSHGV